MDFDRITTSNWTVAFPNDWVEQATEDGALYLVSPDGEKGFYLSLWEMSVEELRTPEELVASFQQADIKAMVENNEGWELLHQEVNSNQEPAVGFWEGYSKNNLYRISGKQFAIGKLVLRATFHDYYCENLDSSRGYFSPIIDSLELYQSN